MKFHNEDEGAPCKNMEVLLQQVADGSAKGVKKAYALAHAAQCKHCGNFLQRLKVTLEILRESKRESAPEESISRLREKIKNLESQP